MDPDKQASEAARALGKRRWAGITEGERQEFMAKARSKIKLTKAERSEIGRKAVNARWAEARASKKTDQSTNKKARGKRSKSRQPE
jgi:hypothetical protein